MLTRWTLLYLPISLQMSWSSLNWIVLLIPPRLVLLILLTNGHGPEVRRWFKGAVKQLQALRFKHETVNPTVIIIYLLQTLSKTMQNESVGNYCLNIFWCQINLFPCRRKIFTCKKWNFAKKKKWQGLPLCSLARQKWSSFTVARSIAAWTLSVSSSSSRPTLQTQRQKHSSIFSKFAFKKSIQH